MAIDPSQVAPTTPASSSEAQQPEPQQAPPAAQPANDDDATAQSGGKTPEEVEAFWRNRVSKKDKAHSAAERAYQQEIEELRGKLAQQPAQAQGSDGQPGTGLTQADVQRQIEEREQQVRQLYERKLKYPALVATGASDAVFQHASEAELAKLNALADDNPAQGTFIAPTSPARGAPATAKAINQMDKKELLELLKVEAPREAARLAQQG